MVKINKKLIDYVKTGFMVVFGNAMLAFLVAAFIIPNDIVMGGITGIALVLNKLFGFNTVAVVFISNTIILFLGLIVIGKRLFFTSIASTFLYPLFLYLIQKIPNIDSLTDNTLLASLFAGVLMGFSLGIVMRVGSSTGGTDITNLIFSKLTHKSVAMFVYISDIIIVASQAVVANSESIMMGIVVLVLESIVLDKTIIFGTSQIEIFVISRKYDEIRKKLLTELKLGVTMSYIETGALKEKSKGIICVIHPRSLFSANELIRSIDPGAFITVTKIKEVSGQGFTQDRQTLAIKNPKG